MTSANPEIVHVGGETAGEIAYRQIRRDIVFGTLAPGTRLRLDRLKDPYLVSVSTLREIFNRLASERLVVAEDQRGFRVSPVSQGHFREIAAMRELLEAHALRQSFEQGDIEWESQVVAAHYKLAKMEALIEAGDTGHTEAWKRYDREFHAALIAACGSRALMETHRGIFDHYLRYQIVAVIYRGEAASEEHRQLMECALARDASTAAAILARHIRACVDHTLDNGLLSA
ncbi:FCD domain-containing protein [Oricola sp.]|uniref:GntR family transcriptional regulator n=1 Tax=Oricola sp. TaxID=1979950 RepID=UPI00260134C4|nr:FCD domain-containing protein [Oricola sp.]MCI5077334.1 FCD domain-containing protein [Oricola sp.]